MSGILPDDDRPRFRSLFARWLRGHIARRFHAVRMTRGSRAAFEAAARSPGPVLLACNHQSWWDPLVGFLMHATWFGDRPPLVPMDRTQLEKFRFFRKVGTFGVDPDDAGGMRPFLRHVESRFASGPRTVLMMTPQGRFVDPRDPVATRPGAAMVAARAPGIHVLAVAIEYAFWTDQRPEVMLHAAAVAPPAGPEDARAWQEAIERAMNANAAGLAHAVRGRDPGAFELVLGGGSARIHPVYDAFLRLTGRGTAIDTAHRGGARA